MKTLRLSPPTRTPGRRCAAGRRITYAAAVGLLEEGCTYDAAICSPALLNYHPELHVLQDNIGDNKNAVTRFVLLSRTADIPEPTGSDKTTLTVPLPTNRAGDRKSVV